MSEAARRGHVSETAGRSLGELSCCDRIHSLIWRQTTCRAGPLFGLPACNCCAGRCFRLPSNWSPRVLHEGLLFHSGRRAIRDAQDPGASSTRYAVRMRCIPLRGLQGVSSHLTQIAKAEPVSITRSTLRSDPLASLGFRVVGDRVPDEGYLPIFTYECPPAFGTPVLAEAADASELTTQVMASERFAADGPL